MALALLSCLANVYLPCLVLLFRTPRTGSCLSCRFRTSHLPNGFPCSVYARIAIVYGFCFFFCLSSLLPGIFRGNCAFAFSAGWFSSRSKVLGTVCMAPRPRFHREAFYTPSPSDTCLGRFRGHLSRIHTVTLWHAYFGMKSIPGASRRRSVCRAPLFRAMRVRCTATAISTWRVDSSSYNFGTSSEVSSRRGFPDTDLPALISRTLAESFFP